MPPKKEKVELPSCSICCSTLNKSKNKPVSCDFCSKDACLECIKHYILDTHGDFHCMFCRNKWNRDVLVQKLPQTFIKDELREHHENKIVEIEKARLPAAQTVAENRIKMKNVEMIREIVNRLACEKIGENNEAQIELIKLIAKNYGIDEDINQLSSVLQNLESEAKTEVKRNYVRNCPNNSCRGFINEEWKCGLCQTKMCKKCFEQVEDEKKHKCDQNIIESNKLIEKDSKPCPKCNCLITKLSGCDQMFCVQCHTAFSWTKGTIEKGVIHNPHYYQWQKSLQQNTPQMQQQLNTCDDNYFPTYSTLASVKTNDSYIDKNLARFHQFITHVYSVIRPDHLRTATEDLKMEINVNYMMTVFGKTEWKRQLYAVDRKQEMARDVLELIDMVYGISGERFRNFIKDGDKEHIKDVERVLVYMMDELDKIKKRHISKLVIIHEPSWLTEMRPIKSI